MAVVKSERVWNPVTKRIEVIDYESLWDGKQLFVAEEPAPNMAAAREVRVALTGGELRTLIIAALKQEPHSVEELAALCNVDRERAYHVVASLRPKLEVVERIRKTDRRGRVWVQVYRWRGGVR